MGARSYFLPEDLGLQAVHQRPHVAGPDKIMKQFRLDVREAWAEWHRLEINPPHAYAALLFDVDDPIPGVLDGRPKVVPSWIVQNLQNGHCHVGYALETPVSHHDAARMAPVRYAAHVADRLSVYLGADPGYTAIIHRNPTNPGPDCNVWQPELWLRTNTLESLDKAIPTSVKPPVQRQTGVGRNVDLFTAMVSEVYRPRWTNIIELEGWTGRWLDYVRARNEIDNQDHHKGLLPDSHCKSIAKSCWKYWTKRAHWLYKDFSELQKERQGKRWHGRFDFDFQSRDASILALADFGMKQKDIADIVELSKGRVSQVLKKFNTKTDLHSLGVVEGGADLLTPSHSKKGKDEALPYLPPTSWRVVTSCPLCHLEGLHSPGPVLCLRCGALSVDVQERHRLPMKK